MTGLTGKAVPFIEALHNEYRKIFDGGLDLPMIDQLDLAKNGSMRFCLKYEELYKIYSQPFQPEMITELFDNDFQRINGELFSQDCPDSYVEITFDDSVDRIIFNYLDGTITYYTEAPAPTQSDPMKMRSLESEFNIPLTLNDFISDCARAGIELNWKG